MREFFLYAAYAWIAIVIVAMFVCATLWILGVGRR